MADTVAIGDLYEKISDPDRIAADAFGILRRLCALVNAEDNKSGEVDSEVQELVLRALEQREAFGPASVVLAGLVRRLGLFPYLDADSLGGRQHRV